MEGIDRPWVRLLVAGVLYLGCTLLFFQHDLPTLTTNLIGPPEDNMQEFWNTWYAQQPGSLTSLGDWFFTRELFFPEGVSLRYHSFSYSNLVLIRLLRTIFSLPSSLPVLVGLHNTMVLASFPLAGMGAYYLAYYLTGCSWAAWVGGFVFAFSPFHFAHSLHHLHVASIQYLPVFVLFVLRLEATNKVRYGLGAVICFVLGALSSWYYLVYNLFFLLFLYQYRALQARRIVLHTLLFQSAAIAGSSLLLLSPLIVPMISEASGNPRVYEVGHNTYVADLVGLFAFHPYHLAADWTEWINRRMSGNAWEASVYLGVVNLGLLVWALVRKPYRRDPVLRWAVWGMLFFLLFAGGEVLHILGVPVRYVFLPTALLERLPLLRNLRTASRAISYTYLFLGIAVARILSTLRNSQVDRRQTGSNVGWRTIGVMAIVTGLLLDYWSVNRESTPVTCPSAYATIASDTSAFGILDLPMTYEGGSSYMMYQLCHRRPIVHAAVGRKLTRTLSDLLGELGPADQEASLRAAHVKYVVVHTRRLPSDPPVDLVAYERSYRTVYRDATEIVFRVY